MTPLTRFLFKISSQAFSLAHVGLIAYLRPHFYDGTQVIIFFSRRAQSLSRRALSRNAFARAVVRKASGTPRMGERRRHGASFTDAHIFS